MKQLVKSAAALILAAVVLFGVKTALAETAAANLEVTRQTMYGYLLPDGGTFVEEDYSGEDTNITAVYKGDTGYVIETTTAGYVNDIVLLTGVRNDGTVSGVMPVQLHETFGLGQGAVKAPFLAQFLNSAGDVAVGEEIDALTGATVTSKAVTKGVNSAVAFVTGADVSSSASVWEG